MIGIGKSTGPIPFKAAKSIRTRGNQIQHHDDAEQRLYQDTQEDQEQERERYDPPVAERRGFTGPGKVKHQYRPSKMNQSTKFDTPIEKGTRPHVGDTRSSDTSQRIRKRRDHIESDNTVVPSQDEYTPTAASKVTRSRGRVVQQVEQDSFDVDEDFGDSALLLDGPIDDGLGEDYDDKVTSNIIPPTPPSDRTLAMGHRHSKASKVITKPKTTHSIGLDMGSDGLEDDIMGMLGDVVKVVSHPFLISRYKCQYTD